MLITSTCANLNEPLLLVIVLTACVTNHLPSLHCTVIGFALDWESHKSFKHDRECLTELLEGAFFQPYPIQRIQLAEVGWESDDKGFERKRGWWFVLSLEVLCNLFCKLIM